MTLLMDSPTLSACACDFIDESELESLLDQPVDAAEVRDVIAKSLAKEPLTEAETAVLLNAKAPDLTEEIFAAARQFKPLTPAQMEDTRQRAMVAMAGKGPCWWNPPS